MLAASQSQACKMWHLLLSIKKVKYPTMGKKTSVLRILRGQEFLRHHSAKCCFVLILDSEQICSHGFSEALSTSSRKTIILISSLNQETTHSYHLITRWAELFSVQSRVKNRKNTWHDAVITLYYSCNSLLFSPAIHFPVHHWFSNSIETESVHGPETEETNWSFHLTNGPKYECFIYNDTM